MASTDEDGRGGAERILDAAVLLFGEHGVRGTPLKAIAAEAGVSQALIVHHYGSKEGLHTACDEHVARAIRDRKEETIGAETTHQFDPLQALRQLAQGRALLRYLIRTLTEGGDHSSWLIDQMITDAEQYMTQAERAGLVKSSAVPHDRAVLLVIWSLGALALHEHVHRLMGVDFLAADTPPDSLQRYLRPAMELFSQGLLEEGTFEEWGEFFAGSSAPETTGSPGHEASYDDLIRKVNP